jgi:hypothetical protein
MGKSNHEKNSQPQPQAAPDQGNRPAEVGGHWGRAGTERRADFFLAMINRRPTK